MMKQISIEKYQLINITEINAELEKYEDRIFLLQHKIAVEKQKKTVNPSTLGRLRFELKKAHDKYCELYLSKYEM